MLYRIEVFFPRDNEPDFSTRQCGAKVLVNLTSMPDLADFVEDEMELPGPKDFSNQEAIFFFTELGYEQFGKRLAAKAQELGYDICIKGITTPEQDAIAYEDEFQMAVLPVEKRSRRMSKRDKERSARQHKLDPQ
jgi:hypothetical protein